MGRPGLCPSFCGGPDVGLTKDPMMLSTTWRCHRVRPHQHVKEWGLGAVRTWEGYGGSWPFVHILPPHAAPAVSFKINQQP